MINFEEKDRAGQGNTLVSIYKGMVADKVKQLGGSHFMGKFMKIPAPKSRLGHR